MAEKAFLQIKEAELKAHAIIKAAQEEAARIIKLAEDEASDAFLQLNETYSRQASDNKSQAESEALSSSENYSKETEKMCSLLKQNLLSKKSEAVDEVIQLIIT